MRWHSRTSIARSLFTQSTVLLVLGAIGALIVLTLDARATAERNATQRSLDLATTIAASPTVSRTLAESAERFDDEQNAAVRNARDQLQPYVLQLVEETGIDFVTVMHPSGTRYTHPNPDVIGEQFLGTIKPAVTGGIVTETYEGTLGPSVRAVVPVTESGEVVGLVAAGVKIDKVEDVVMARVSQVSAILLAAVVGATFIAWLMARRVRRATGGHDPEALARLFATHEAALHSVDDGLVLIGNDRIHVINDRARTVLGLDEPTPIRLDQVRSDVAELLTEDVDSAILDSRSLALDQSAIEVLDTPARMVTIRDRTALAAMAGELDSVRTMTRALRSQTHEYGNRLHTIATLIELGETGRALELAAPENGASQRLTDRVVATAEEPVIAALLAGKAAEAHERAVDLFVETHLEPGTQGYQPEHLVTIVGNLIDNGIDAAALACDEGRGWVEVYLARDDDDSVVIQVVDSGSGINESDRELIFRTGWSTKSTGDQRGFGLAIVRQTVEQLGGAIEIDRHRGTGTALTVRLPKREVVT